MYHDRNARRYGWVDQSRVHPFQTWGDCPVDDHSGRYQVGPAIRSAAQSVKQTVRHGAHEVKSGIRNAGQKVKENIKDATTDLRKSVRENVDTYKARLGEVQSRFEWLNRLMPAPVVYAVANLLTYGGITAIMQLFLGVLIHTFTTQPGFHSQWITASNIILIACLSFMGGDYKLSKFIPTLCLLLLGARYLGRLTSRYRHFVAKCNQSSSQQQQDAGNKSVQVNRPLSQIIKHYVEEALFVIMLCSPVILANSQFLGPTKREIPVFTLYTPLGTLSIPNLLKYSIRPTTVATAKATSFGWSLNSLDRTTYIGVVMFMVGYLSSLYFDYTKRKIRETTIEAQGRRQLLQDHGQQHVEEIRLAPGEDVHQPLRPGFDQRVSSSEQDVAAQRQLRQIQRERDDMRQSPEQKQQQEQQQKEQEQSDYFMNQGIFSYVRNPQIISMIFAKMGLWVMCLNHYDHIALNALALTSMVVLITWKIFGVLQTEQRRLGINAMAPIQGEPSSYRESFRRYVRNTNLMIPSLI